MISKLLSKAGDAFSDWTGYAATRVPLSRASGPDEVTLGLPGYCQLDSYGCGVVAGVMALKHFKPRASFSAFYARVSPHAEHGTPTSRLIGALQRSGLRVTERDGLTFADLCAAIDAGSPVIVAIQNPGADVAHWVTVYGYGLEPDRVFLATNGFPFVATNVFPLRQFARIWSPHGNGLLCAAPKRAARPTRPARKARRVAALK
ncbi:MAG: papain-like cysteine protease family protein [Limisphaerales bacterium]